MVKYLAQVKHLIGVFDSFEIQRIPRSQNTRADALSKLASTSFSEFNKMVLVKILPKPSYEENVMCSIDSVGSWMTPIVDFLNSGSLSENRSAARKIRRLAPRYAIINTVLYRKSYSGPWLRCLTPEHGEEILHSIHEGICGSHIDSRALMLKALLLGYFWLTMRKDS